MTNPTNSAWRVGKNYGSVVSDTRPAGYPYDHAVEVDRQHYGGYVICESCTEENARHIAVLPEVFGVLRTLAREGHRMPPEEIQRLAYRAGDLLKAVEVKPCSTPTT